MIIDIYAARPTRAGVYTIPRSGTKSTVVCDLPCEYHGLTFTAELWLRETRKDGDTGVEIEASLPKGVSFGPPTSADSRAFKRAALASAMVDLQYNRWEAQAMKRLEDAINGVEETPAEKGSPTKRTFALPKPKPSGLEAVSQYFNPKTGHEATDQDKAQARKDNNPIDTSVLSDDELDSLTTP